MTEMSYNVQFLGYRNTMHLFEELKYSFIWEKHEFYLRSTQLMAIIIFLKTEDQGVLEQVSTGEGKSLIIVALAIVKKALQRENVDVITSSSVLAGNILIQTYTVEELHCL